MTALVFGATGLTGRHTVEALVQRGEQVVAHVRADSPRLGDWQRRFEKLGAKVSAAPWNPEAIASLLAEQQPSQVFALLGTTQARAKKEGLGSGKAAYDAVDVGLTQMLIQGALAVKDAPRFVYLSSAGAGGGQGAYLAARKQIEDQLIAGPLPYTIARPSSIVGERDDARPMEKFGVPVLEGALRLFGALGGKHTAARYRAITGEALANALVRLAFDPSWAQRIAEREDLG